VPATAVPRPPIRRTPIAVAPTAATARAPRPISRRVTVIVILRWRTVRCAFTLPQARSVPHARAIQLARTALHSRLTEAAPASAARGDLRLRNDDDAAHAFWGEGQLHFAFERLAYHALDHGAAKTGPLRSAYRRPTLFFPG